MRSSFGRLTLLTLVSLTEECSPWTRNSTNNRCSRLHELNPMSLKETCTLDALPKSSTTRRERESEWAYLCLFVSSVFECRTFCRITWRIICPKQLTVRSRLCELSRFRNDRKNFVCVDSWDTSMLLSHSPYLSRILIDNSANSFVKAKVMKHAIRRFFCAKFIWKRRFWLAACATDITEREGEKENREGNRDSSKRGFLKLHKCASLILCPPPSLIIESENE